MSRPKLPKEVSTEVLVRSRRRCCICFGLHGDLDQKRGQLAHLDKNPTNNEFGNIVYLCLEHHDEYDGKTSQSKSIMPEEVRRYCNDLYLLITKEVSSRTNKHDQTQLAGDYWRFKEGPSMDEITAALDFYAGPHRTRSVLILLNEGPKTLAELQEAIPGEPDWIKTIADGVVASRLAFGPLNHAPRYRISPMGERMLKILEAIPEFIKNAAWDANWNPKK